MTKTTPRERAAWHEASHVITARALGVPVSEAKIIGRRGRGVVATAGVDSTLRHWRLGNDYRQDDLAAAASIHIQISLAGPIGEALFMGDCAGCGADTRMIEALARQYAVSDARVRLLKRRTERLLITHWCDVIRVAEALLRHGVLSREEICAV